MFKINYGYGTRADEDLYTTLEAAMEAADDGAAYTQQDMQIFELTDNGENLVAQRNWYGVAPSEDDKECDIIQFGDFGFFGGWILY